MIILFLLNFITSQVFSQNPLIIPDSEKIFEIPDSLIRVYCDSTNSLALSQIKSEKFSSSFVPLNDLNSEPSYKYTYWLHLSIEKNTITKSDAGLFIPLEDHLADVYTVTDSAIILQKTGFFVNSDKNDEIIPLSNLLRIKGNGEINIYVKIKNINNEVPRFNLKIADTNSIFLKSKRKIAIDAIVQGMIWLMVLYGIFLFFLHREKIYLYYSIYSVCLSLWLMGTWGFYYHFIHTLPRSIYPYQSIPGFFGIIFYIQFIRIFFNTSSTLPTWNRILKIIQFFALVEILRISVFIPATNLLMTNYYIQASVSMIVELFMMAFIIKILLTKVQFKYVIGIGSAILIIANFSGAFLWIVSNDNTWFILQKAGAVVELAMFSFGLSYRYWVIEKNEQILQKKLIIQLNRNSELQDKVNRELEQKVQERTFELKEKNEILEQQKNEIEYHNNNLKISINYAHRIQSAVFPPVNILSSKFPEHFILFKPLDVVSGDFYWFRQTGNFLFVAAADCTGHGVPGAFMSILGLTFLNELVSTDVTVGANELLGRLRNHVIKTLHQSRTKTSTRDGIEMSLCKFDLQSHKLEYSGAFRPIYIIRNNQLTEMAGDCMPIGIYDEEEYPFTNKEMALRDDDIIYLFTDGYVDQIGGESRKTFKTGRLKELLIGICSLPMDEQKQQLENKIEEWRGDLEQVDDILVIGIRYRNVYS